MVARGYCERHRSEASRIPCRARDTHRASGPSRRYCPWRNPSRTVHAVCAYWLTSSDGSSAQAQAQHASRMPATTPALLRTFLICLHLNSSRRCANQCLCVPSRATRSVAVRPPFIAVRASVSGSRFAVVAFSSHASICGDIFISWGPQFSPYGATVKLSHCSYCTVILTLCVNPHRPSVGQ